MFKKLWTLVIGKFRAFAAAAFPAAKKEILGLLADVATQAVTIVKESGLSNDEKRKLAFEKIKQYAIERGIEAKDHMIDLALAMALSALKG